MQMGNIMPRVEIEPTSLEFWAGALTITPAGLSDVTTLFTHTGLCGSLSEKSVQTCLSKKSVQCSTTLTKKSV